MNNNFWVKIPQFIHYYTYIDRVLELSWCDFDGFECFY